MREKKAGRDRAAKDTYEDYAGTFSTLPTLEGDSTLEFKGRPSAKSDGQVNMGLTALAMATRAKSGCRETTFALPGLRENA